METITIASIERQPAKQQGWSDTWKIKLTNGDMCFANIGSWNSNWAQGMTVQALKGKKKPDQKYWNLACPPELNPKTAALYQGQSTQGTNEEIGGKHEEVMKALRIIYKILQEQAQDIKDINQRITELGSLPMPGEGTSKTIQNAKDVFGATEVREPGEEVGDSLNF